MIRPLRGGSRLRRALAGAVVVTALAAGVPIALGQFSDAAAIGTNSFTTASCWSAVKTLQKGEATSSADGTLVVSIASVDPAKAFLLFNTRSSSNRPVASFVRGRLATATTLEFVRLTNETTPLPIVIQWYVVEYACGVNVQRGSMNPAATVTDIAITPVASVGQAFVTWSKTPLAADNGTEANDTLVAELTTPSNLQVRIASAAATHEVWWQVIEFTSPADINVQKGSASLLGTALTTTATIPSPVPTGRTFVLASVQTTGAGADMGARLVRAELTDSTTITFTREASGTPDDITEIHWHAVTLTGAEVRHGTASFAAGEAQRTVSFAAVDTSRAVGVASVHTSSGQSGGSSSYVGDDLIGVSSFTASVDSATQLTLRRTSTVAGANVGWFVVQFR